MLLKLGCKVKKSIYFRENNIEPFYYTNIYLVPLDVHPKA